MLEGCLPVGARALAAGGRPLPADAIAGVGGAARGA